MIELKLREVALAARARYDAGTLSAQAPDPVCMYRSVQRGVTYACGIGAGLTDDQLAALAQANEYHRAEDRVFQGESLRNLLGGRADKPVGLSALQVSHDNWANTRNGAMNPHELGAESVEAVKLRFLAMLDSILATPRASDPAAQVRETEETEREAGDDSAND